MDEVDVVGDGCCVPARRREERPGVRGPVPVEVEAEVGIAAAFCSGMVRGCCCCCGCCCCWPARKER
jgi:hypothetical protein